MVRVFAVLLVLAALVSPAFGQSLTDEQIQDAISRAPKYNPLVLSETLLACQPKLSGMTQEAHFRAARYGGQPSRGSMIALAECWQAGTGLPAVARARDLERAKVGAEGGTRSRQGFQIRPKSGDFAQ